MHAMTGLSGLSGFRTAGGEAIKDDFNRANSTSTLGSTNTGQVWTAHQGTWGIASNAAYVVTSSGPGWNEATVESGGANVMVQGQVAVVAGAFYGVPRLLFRFTDTANYLYVEAHSVNGWALKKREAGSETTLGSPYATAATNNDVVKVVANGSALEVFVNAVSRITATSAFNVSATRCGIAVKTTTNGTIDRWDNFEVASA